MAEASPHRQLDFSTIPYSLAMLMKKISLIFGLVFLIISACLIYLVRSGVSLRSEPLIRPTIISPDQRNIAAHVVLRLFPELQNSHYILWGVLPESNDAQLMMTYFMEEYYKTFHIAVHIIQDGEKATASEIAQCEKPCWILLPMNRANELSKNEFIQKNILPLNRHYINMTLSPFTGEETVPESCDQQKRLNLECITPVSVREVHRKIKDPSQLYFFLRKYNENDFFLFVQKPINKK